MLTAIGFVEKVMVKSQHKLNRCECAAIVTQSPVHHSRIDLPSSMEPGFIQALPEAFIKAPRSSSMHCLWEKPGSQNPHHSRVKSARACNKAKIWI